MLTFNSDGAQRSRDIHWPEGFHPEQANLFAHNEIDVHASCTKAFANLVDAEAWPTWYPNSHIVKILTAGDGKLHEGSRARVRADPATLLGVGLLDAQCVRAES
jgi:hypothetical protein